ncbi:MAG: toxin-antitoxin system HicB family antitoxin [Casimicrobiaceae bacterium]
MAGAAMAEKKAFLLRLDPAVWTALERIAQSDLRSVNAEVEFLLRDALSRRGIAPGQRPRPASPPRTVAPSGSRGRGNVD